MYPDAEMPQGCRLLPPPSTTRVTIDHMTEERVNLYQNMSLPVRTIPVEVTPFPVVNSSPYEDEIAWVVRRICLNFYGVSSVMQVEQLRKWLRDMTWEDYTDNTHWRKVVGIIQ